MNKSFKALMALMDSADALTLETEMFEHVEHNDGLIYPLVDESEGEVQLILSNGETVVLTDDEVTNIYASDYGSSVGFDFDGFSFKVSPLKISTELVRNSDIPTQEQGLGPR